MAMTMKEAGQARAMKIAATKRALIAAHFANNPQEQTPMEVAEALGKRVVIVRPALEDAAERGLIRRTGGRLGRYSALSLDVQGTSEGQPPKPEAPVVKRQPEAKTPVTTAVPASKDVELIVAGVLVVIGKNPITGRLRIQIEDMAP